MEPCIEYLVFYLGSGNYSCNEFYDNKKRGKDPIVVRSSIKARFPVAQGSALIYILGPYCEAATKA